MASASGNNQALTEKAQGALADQKKSTFTQVITQDLARQFKAMKSLVPKHVTPERMARVGLQAISRTPDLMKCTPESVVGAIMNCATLGLEPNLIGHAYLVPFFNGKSSRWEAQFVIGYKGLLDLVRRTGDVSRVYAYEVQENDEFEYELGVNATLKHKPAMTDRGQVIGYYAVYHLKDGGYGFFYLSKDEAMEHALKFSKSQKDKRLFGPWADHFDEMAKKTALRAMMKYMPISVEAYEGISRDEAVIKVQPDKTGITDEAFFTATYESGEAHDGSEPDANADVKADTDGKQPEPSKK